MSFIILLDPEVIIDIQDAIEYYDEQQAGLGKRFEKCVDKYFHILEENPLFQMRYDSIRCIPLTEFPFMIHFSVDEINKQVIIRAVFHTARSPKHWKKKK